MKGQVNHGVGQGREVVGDLLDLAAEGGFYLVPPVAGTPIKIGDHSFSRQGHPDDDRTPDPARRHILYPDLEGHVRTNRAMLVRAALTLLSGWCASGRPTTKILPLSSFEAWSSVVRQCVVWCGMPDPALAIGKATDDAVDAARAHLLGHLRPLCPVRPGELVKLFTSDAKRPGGAELGALSEFLQDCGVKILGTGAQESIGRYLRKHVGIPCDLHGESVRLVRRQVDSGHQYDIERIGKR